MANNETTHVTCAQYNAPVFASRVRNNNAAYITQATVSSITYTIYRKFPGDPERLEPITTHTNISCTVDSVVFDTLQTDTTWGAKDTIGYNFAHQPSIAGSVFSKIGTERYLVVYTIVPTSGEPLYIRFLVSVTM